MKASVQHWIRCAAFLFSFIVDDDHAMTIVGIGKDVDMMVSTL